MGEGDPPQDGKGILHPEGMGAVRAMAAGVVHEVNNILGVVIGNAHLAQKTLSDRAALEKYLGEVRAAAEEGRELMRQLAGLAADDALRPRVLSLNDLVTSTVSGVRKRVDLDLSGEDPAVELDLWLAQEALGSLVRFMAETNAVSSLRIATRAVGSCLRRSRKPTVVQSRAWASPSWRIWRRASAATRPQAPASRMGSGSSSRCP
jgi:hypothetical protein